MTLNPPFDAEELLAEVGWVRALARQVAGDAHAADDLAQDALLVALRGAPDRPRSLRSWLGAVVRNLGRTARRGERRRARREADAGRPEAAPSTLELVERAATQRALVGTLLALEEPYRGVLLERFFEGRSPREIADRSGVPESTVATRSAEGIRRLRARLAARGEGGERPWLSSVLPLLASRRSSSPPAAATRGLAVSIKTKAVLVGVVLLGGWLAWRGLDRAGPAGGGAVLVAEPGGAPAAGAAPSPPALRSSVPPAEDLPLEPPPAEPAPGWVHPPIHDRPALEPWPVRGRVIDLDGRPVPGVDVCVVADPSLSDAPRPAASGGGPRCATSGADGGFALEGAPPEQVAVHSELYATVFAGQFYAAGEQRDPVVVVGWRIPLAGVVVDGDGNGVAGAAVSLWPMGRSLNPPGDVLGASRLVLPTAECDERGAFALAGAAELPEAQLHVRAPGYQRVALPVPEGGDGHLRIVLSRSALGRYALAGRVVLPDGSPAADALVSAGTLSVRADREGAFVLDFELSLGWMERDAPLQLAAALAGHRPAVRALPSIAEGERDGWPEDLVLELGGPPLTIRGRVVDGGGRALPGVRVELVDATRFGLVMGPQGSWGFMRTLEELAGGGEVSTDAAGEFELGGLRERSYRLRVVEPFTLIRTVTEPIEAGAGSVTVVLDRTALGRIAGRVVDRAGRELGGVQVAVSDRRAGGLDIGRSATTDSAGRFALEGVTTEPAFLRIEGEDIVPELFRDVPPGADLQALELVVERRARLQVEWSEWVGRADELQVVGEGGVPLELVDLDGGGLTPRPSIEVVEGLSPALAVPASAVEAILLRGGEEVARVPLQLAPGELLLLRL